MTFSDFEAIVARNPAGVVLLEGRRSIPAEDAEKAEALAVFLARTFPRLRFRSGNATGSDEAFSRGIARHDAQRLEIIAPTPTHRKKDRYPDAQYDSPESLSKVQEQNVIRRTIEATPKAQRMIEKRDQIKALKAKSAYLIRDTMKVTGCDGTVQKPICALFYVDLVNPEDGGTGHTIRVCQHENVPHVFQDEWGRWSTI